MDGSVKNVRDLSCSSCDNSGKCSACIQNYNLDQKQKQCLLTCNSNQFAQVDQNSSQQVCQLCDPSCSTCSGTSKSCTSCSNNYYTFKTSPSDTNFLCYSTCPDGYYQFSQDCLKCDNSCNTCTGNSLSCTACSNSYYPYKATPSATNFQCYQVCPSGSYFLQNQCLQCDASCNICTGSSTNCTACSNTYYPLKIEPTATNFQCYQKCPNGYYLQFQQCLKCDASCDTCSDSSLSCTSCANNYYQVMTMPSSTNFQCYQTCPDGYYLYNNHQCKQCDVSCSSCSGTSTSCIACNNTYFPLKIQPSDINYKCYQICPDGYFLQQQQQECLQCDFSCSKCVFTNGLYFATLLSLGLCYFGKTMDSKIPVNSNKTLAAVISTHQINNINSQQPKAQKLQTEEDQLHNQIIIREASKQKLNSIDSQNILNQPKKC
ncbi:zinc finger lsd1 subclass family protein (macronuclear) [Tetrahymena thermophila SB210]|uniref:Zinc finger lsd1 subclass family protein n=1 Tax=Tetrahymena thermophila (strain SB210) TaxID=312017 RepID=Q22DJ6_TETTS|nr:zinc finger lsd1 subclass family protein [Tetrahymena thermophila SB210]EAR83362.2 zinc finger lsd1 subclass family protein [Tetrahymena thermophila SB210]|eukprot:XP_001031025.2 zinc finger lsd1 subclass family protein [Tetrahymena thermophila SB210]